MFQRLKSVVFYNIPRVYFLKDVIMVIWRDKEYYFRI